MRRDPSLRPSVSPGSGPRVDSTSTTHLDWSESLGTGLVNPNTFPAKFSFNTNAYSCTSDFIVYPPGLTGSGKATILAYNELYGTSGPNGTGCGAGTSGSVVPKAYWAYNTAYPQGSTTLDGSLVTTSPVLSLAGDQVAFIQVNSSSVASLVLLKWATGTSVVALDTATNQCDRRELSRLHRSVHDQDHSERVAQRHLVRAVLRVLRRFAVRWGQQR